MTRRARAASWELKETEGKRIIMIIDSFVERTSGGLDDTALCALHKGGLVGGGWGGGGGGGGYIEPYNRSSTKNRNNYVKG